MRITNIFTNYKSEIINEVTSKISKLLEDKLSEANKVAIKPINKGELLMSQINTVDNFDNIFGNLSDSEREEIVEMCYTLSLKPAWSKFIDGLKKEKLEIFIGYSESNDESNDWLRGSINGISIIDASVKDLANTYKEKTEERKTEFVKSESDLVYE